MYRYLSEPSTQVGKYTSAQLHTRYLEVLVVTPVARREMRWSMELEVNGSEIVGIKLLSMLLLDLQTENLFVKIVCLNPLL